MSIATKTSLDGLTAGELRACLHQKGLPLDGLKPALVDKLHEHLKKTATAANNENLAGPELDIGRGPIDDIANLVSLSKEAIQ